MSAENRKTISRADRELLAACDALDLDRALTAIFNGANVNTEDPRDHMMPVDILASFALEAELAPDFRNKVRQLLTLLLLQHADPDGINGSRKDVSRATPLQLFDRHMPGGVCSQMLARAGAHSHSAAERPARTPDAIAQERL